jgi:hypothetical protein
VPITLDYITKRNKLTMETYIIDSLIDASPLQLIMITIITILAILYKSIGIQSKKGYKWVYNLIFKNRMNNKILKLQYHDMFQVIEEVRNTVKHTKFYQGKELDSTKSAMFVDFMNFKLDAVRDSFQDLIEGAVDSNDNNHLKNQVFDAIFDSIGVYTSATRMLFVEKGIPYEDANYVVELFERWRLDTVSSAGQRINSIFASNYHQTKFDNLLAVLEMISMAISLIPKDGVAAFNSMNGKFMKLKYK